MESVQWANALALWANFVGVPALTYACQLALGALGVTLLYAVLRFAHFAHGEMMAFGTMVVIFATAGLQAAGVSIAPLPTALLALPLGMLATVLLAWCLDWSVYEHHRRVRSPAVVKVMVSIGVLLVLNGLVRMVIGPGTQHFADGERFLLNVREFRALTGLDEGVAIRMSQVLSVVTALLAMLALFVFMRFTRMGKAMRAYADNADLARLSGIEPGRVVRVTWLIAACLATLAGTLYGLDKSFQPIAYFNILLPVFAAAVVGGIGHPVGAVVGGFVVAFSEIGLTYAYRKFFGYLLPESWQPDGLAQLVSTDYKFAISFIILVVVLVLRPSGLFKSRAL